jgi:hypothetical protein
VAELCALLLAGDIVEAQRDAARSVEHDAAPSFRSRPTTAERREAQARNDRERVAWWTTTILPMVEEFAQKVRLEVTTELLASTFALGDGTDVTWGEATVEQHRQRIDLLARMAEGTIETAARHQAAIDLIEENGVARLAEVVA